MKAVYAIASAISGRSRRKKFSQFLQWLQPQASETILDVGINTTEYSPYDNYLEKYYQHPERITAVAQDAITDTQQRYPQIHLVQADGRQLPFADNTFALSYSNAVIEHVGDITEQVRFLAELYRVSTRGYITTPYRYFPIEVHTRIPLLHILLPKTYFDSFLRLIGKGWAAGEYMHLLSITALRAVLTQAGVQHYTIKINRLLGFPMTLVVVWHK